MMKCLIIEDHEEYRAFIEQIIKADFSHLEIIRFKDFQSANHFVKEEDAQIIEIAIIDIGLPDGSGIDLITAIKAKSPKALCIIATIFDSDAYLFNALEMGADGYILKDAPPDEVHELILRIKNGEPPISPSIAKRILTSFSKPITNSGNLTNREIETLKLLAKGMTNAEVASELNLSAQTVASYVKVIYQKLNVHNRAQASIKAAQIGLIDPNKG